MYRTGVCILLGFNLVGIPRNDDTEVTLLKAKIERLVAENEALREALEKTPDARAARERLGLDVRLLERMVRLMKEKPDDEQLRTDAVNLAKRIAPQSLGSRVAWELLIETKVVEDGMTQERAERLLGPATDKTSDWISWYDNPGHKRHVAPCLIAKITEKGLMQWKIINR